MSKIDSFVDDWLFIRVVLLERILTYYRYGSWVATSTSLHLQVYAKADSLIDLTTIAQGENKGFSSFKLLIKAQPEGLLAPLFLFILLLCRIIFRHRHLSILEN